MYISVVTLSKENDIKLLELLKSGFKRTIKWNKYRSQLIVQPQNNNLNYLIDPTFTNVNKLFVLLFARTNAGDSRDSFSHYYTPSVDIKQQRALQIKHFREHYRLIAIDLSKQTNLKDPQQIYFIGRLEENNGATVFFVSEKSEQITFSFLQNSVTIM